MTAARSSRAIEGAQFQRAALRSDEGDASLPPRVRDDARRSCGARRRRGVMRFPAPAVTARRSRRTADRAIARDIGLDDYAPFDAQLDRLAAAYIVRAFRELGFDFVVGTTFDVLELCGASSRSASPPASLRAPRRDSRRRAGAAPVKATARASSRAGAVLPEAAEPDEVYARRAHSSRTAEAELTL